MNYKNYIKNIAILMCLLVIFIPIVLAEEFNRIYDANGNLISDGKYYREYNGLNQLVRVRLGNTSTSLVLEEYKWHPIEERIVIKRVFSNGVYNYIVYYPNENFVQIVNSSGTFTEKYVYQNSVLVAQVNTDGQKQAIHNDNEGSNVLITASDGSVLENTFYSPFGEIIEGGIASRYDYEGKEYDFLTEDIDFKFRKYNPKEPPIFNQPDDIMDSYYDPQLLNRYTFERNNPIRYIDPKGHLLWDVVDAGLFALDLKDYRENPSLFNAISLTISTISLLPVLPNVAGYVTRGVKTADKISDTNKAVKAADKATEGIKAADKAAEVVKEVNRVDFSSPQAINKVTDDITIKTSDLQHIIGREHADAFGVTGNYNKETAQELFNALKKHITGQNTEAISGTYS